MNTRFSIDEPVFVPACDETLFGILTSPLGSSTGIGVVILAGDGSRNHVFARLARQLAHLGFHVLRVDLQGTGESSGFEFPMSLLEPDLVAVDAAVEFLRSRGLRRF